MDMEDDQPQDMDMGPSGLTCGVWIPQGACKQMPEKYQATEEELARARNKAAMLAAEAEVEKEEQGMGSDEEEVDPGEEPLPEAEEVPEMDDDDDDEDDGADIDGYDGPTLDVPVQGVDGVQNIESDDESEINDLQIKPDDCVFLCTHQRRSGQSTLEVYIYDDDRENIYLHHDMMLPAIPLSVSWSRVGRKAGEVVEDGSFAAVSTFLPFIEVWDLDVTDQPDPSVTLGGCKRESDNYRSKTLTPGMLKKSSHTDAVLCTKWNTSVGKVLASGSADCTVKLWDLGTGENLLTSKHHEAPVQTMEWLKQSPQSLLTGSFDQTVQVLDCRTQKVQGKVRLGAAPESVVLSPFDESKAWITTDNGELRHYDLRSPKNHVWKVQAHQGEAGGLAVNPSVEGLIATAGSDKQIKLWDVRSDPSLIVSRDLQQGRVFSLQFSADKPTYLLASGDSGKPLVYCVTDDVQSAFT
eukprot:TRINITY_DN3137_c0_g1_i1.p1 TRINITY_DN3137_c0_g1~~TRINITY_DN3137_c0_g1_i1.p1  ORF type:complete len:467 (+),score=212.14 TRINITY_DN3137_c0_g1_i1:79-1479(+)